MVEFLETAIHSILEKAEAADLPSQSLALLWWLVSAGALTATYDAKGCHISLPGNQLNKGLLLPYQDTYFKTMDICRC